MYDPPVSRKGLARRIQDNISWAGPAVVVCVERDQGTPKKVWVRLRARVKAYPLEKIRLATADEMLSAEYIVGALKDVEQEISGGRLQVEDYIPPQGPEEDAEAEAEAMEDEEPRQELSAQADRKRELTHDVPQAMKPAETEPHLMPFEKKQRLFEQLAKDLGAPTALEEAAVRDRLEKAYGELKQVRKGWKKEKKEQGRETARGGDGRATSSAAPRTPGASSAAPRTPGASTKRTPPGNGWEQ